MKNLHILGAVLGAALFAGPLSFACDNSSEDPGGDGDQGGDGDFNLGGQGGGQGGGDGPNGPNDCGGEDVEAAPLPANILLVIDSSGSMDEGAPGFEDSKWETLVASLNTALPEVEDSLGLGLKLFPSGDTAANACSVESGVQVEVDEGKTQVPKISTALAEAAPGGDTPTAAALADALEYWTNGAGKNLEGERFVLLATDGGPNCSESPEIDCTCDDPVGKPECGDRSQCTVNYDPDNAFCQDEANGSCCDVKTLCLDDGGTIQAVKDLKSAGIKTIVVGMPGSEAYIAVLDQLAVAGGLPVAEVSPRYTKVDDAVGLTKAMRDVTRGVIRTCEIQLEEEPPRLDQVNVYLDNVVIPKSDSDGWKFDESTTPPTVVFTGETCETVETEGVGKISVRFGCQTIVK